MTRKRLGDLLREEAGKPTPEPAPKTSTRKPAAAKTATAKANGSQPAPEDGEVVPPVTAAAPASTEPEPVVTQPVPEAKPETPAPDTQLQTQLAELQAQLQAQAAHLHDLEVAQKRSQTLETELAAAKKTILQLTDINQSLATQPANQPSTPTTKPSASQASNPPKSQSQKTQPASTPAASAPTQPKQLVEHPALHLRPLQPPTESSATSSPAPVNPTAQAYRFERIGWKPLSNHLLTTEQPHKLSDEDLGWVD
jgi:hypothetical protein